MRLVRLLLFAACLTSGAFAVEGNLSPPPAADGAPLTMERFLVTAKGLDLLVIWIRIDGRKPMGEALEVDRIIAHLVVPGSLFHRHGLRTDMNIQEINGVPVRGLTEKNYQLLLNQPVPAVSFKVVGFLGRPKVITVPISAAQSGRGKPR